MTKYLGPVFFLLLSLAASAAEPLPYPAELKRDVDFWIRIYSDVSTQEGLIHDAGNLGVVYGQIKFPAGSSYAQREKIINKEKRRYEKALKDIAFNPAAPMNFSLRKVKNAWPKGTSAHTFSEASRNVRFQLGQSDRFREGLERSGLWRQHILDTLRQEGLPSELVALPHVESSFNPDAYSKVAAAGMWQFMPGTARDFMRVDHIVDDRMDPFVSTLAAAGLLKRNYAITGTWPLALTAYNHGANGIRRAAESMGTTDIAKLVRGYRGPLFGFASRNFYVSFLAALEIDRNPQKYFGQINYAKPVSYDIYPLPAFVPAADLARSLGTDLATLRKHNPSLRDSVWRGDKYVPKGFSLRFPRQQLNASLASLVGSIPASRRFAYQQPDVIHRIAPGESLSVIARKYNTSVKTLMALNGLKNAHSIRAGKELKLPGTNNQAVANTSAASPVPASQSKPSTYRVKNGDSLWRISQNFNVSQSALLRENPELGAGHLLKVGQTLRIPSASEPSARPQVYVIRTGDSLWGIAKRFDLTVKQLLAWNNLAANHVIKPGDTLKVSLY